uniref:RNA-directed DNA polymerase n=1 Tax=Fagus sylvatica TaxID=28930 RepID=A0A2N9INS0_FAGSY
MGFDRISQLPQQIIHHILFFMPTKDAARTSALSKSWLQAWNSLPRFDLKHSDVTHYDPLNLSNGEEVDIDHEEMFSKFAKSVDETLLPLQLYKAIIPLFKLSVTVWHDKYASRIDNWLELAYRNHVQTLDLDIRSKDNVKAYALPQTTFGVGSLAVLSLKGEKCKLDKNYFSYDMKKTAGAPESVSPAPKIAEDNQLVGPMRRKTAANHPLQRDKSNQPTIFKLLKTLQLIPALHFIGSHDSWYCSRSRFLHNSSKITGSNQNAWEMKKYYREPTATFISVPKGTQGVAPTAQTREEATLLMLTRLEECGLVEGSQFRDLGSHELLSLDVISSAENPCLSRDNQSYVVSSSIQLRNSERLGPKLFFGFLISNDTLGKLHEDSGSHQKEATFVTMSDIADLLKQEREKNPKESRLFVRKPPYPAELLKLPYPEKYIAPTFSRFDGRKGSALVHISKFVDSMGAYAGNGDLCLREFSKSLDDRAYTWYTTLPPGSVKVWEDMVELFCGKYFQAEEKITLVNLHTTKQASGEDLLRYIHRFRDISLDCYANYEEGELVGVCIDNMLPEFRAHLENLDISRFGQLLQKARKTALSVKPHIEKPKEKKNPPQVLTVSTVNNKRKKSNERSFDEAPPPVPCTLEEMKAILDKWVADGIIKLPEAQKKATEEDKKNPKFCYFHQYVHTDPFLKHKDRGVVSVVIHGSTSDVNVDESATASTAMTPTAIKTLQRNPRFRSLFNQLGLNPEARTAATEAIMAIAADSGAHCFTAETHASRAFLETTNAITFTDEDMEVQYPDHRRPLYLSATINEVQVRRALVDNGSCINLIPLSTIQAVEIPQKKIQGAPMEIKGFGDVGEYTKGHIQLVLKVGLIVAFTRFHVVDSVVPYHILLGRPWLHKHQLIPSTYHQCVKGRLNGKPIRIAANSAPFDQSESHFVEAALYDEPSCLAVNEASVPESADAAEPVAADPKISAKEELEVIDLSSDPSVHKPVSISASLSAEERMHLVELLKEYQDVFAWQYDEIPGIDPKLVAHSLNVEPGTKPVVQPMRTFHPEVEAQITQEVKKLLSAGFIKPIQHPRWLSNIVPVKKKNGQIRCCVDFRNLNKACPKDEFPLPNMDLLIDSAAGHAMFSFIDGFSGYNQIFMTPRDAEKTAFRTPIGNFYYTVMPFGLKNAGATYQRTMTAMFHDMMHCEIEDYVDDIVVKSKTRGDHFGILKKVFERCRLYKLKMNPLKCAFGVSAGKFLGFLVHQRGKLSYIRKFIPGLAAVTSTFAPLLKKGAPFYWSTECQEAFEKVQDIMTKLPTVCAPISGKSLRLYLASNSQAIGALIAQENDNGDEQPIYYVSRTLKDAESRYSGAERSCLALIYASQRLRHYFLAHQVQLMTKSHPIKSLLQRSVLSGRLAQWLLQLSQYEIIAETPTAIKSQAIADLLAQFPGEDNSSISDEVPGEINEVFLAGLADSVWTLKFDGSSTATSAGAGIVLYRDDGEAVTKSFKFDFPCSNNAAEYEAYLAGLAIAYEMGIKHLRVIDDSNLVKLEARFSTFKIKHAQRNENRYADALATLGSQIAFGGEEMDITICKKMKPITESLRKEFEELSQDQEDWRAPIKAKLMSPAVTADLREIKDYTLISGDLYRRLPGGVLARCISIEEAKEKLPDIHEKTCGDGGAISLYRRLQRLGYFWPSMSAEAAEIQSRCPTCQFHYSNEEVCATFVSTDWRTPFLEYLLEGILPSNPKDVYRLKRLALRYFVEGGTLFRRGFHGEPLRCLSPSESQMVMKETHAGECGEHQGKKRLYQCLLTLGYYWPTMKKDAADFVKTCHTCQISFSLQNMATPWPFHTWGLDLIGPINPASGGYIWILVATEYFTKWVEAIHLRKATGVVVANFIREHIITRFGIPYKLITDNGTPFINKDVREVLEHYRVKHRRSTPYYPQGNGQAEATNRMLLRILSKMVFDYGNDWKAHLADVLWAYRSSPKTATGFTPFSLVYGTDTISPTELVVPSPRVMQGSELEVDANMCAEARMADLEGLDEARDLAKAKSQRNYQKMANVYNKALRVRIFGEGQMVLKAAEFVRRNLPSPSKFSPNWDGPYIIREAHGSGYYRLSKSDGTTLADPINGKWLKHYYS